MCPKLNFAHTCCLRLGVSNVQYHSRCPKLKFDHTISRRLNVLCFQCHSRCFKINFCHTYSLSLDFLPFVPFYLSWSEICTHFHFKTRFILISMKFYTHLHDIFRLFESWSNFLFTTSESKPDEVNILSVLVKISRKREIELFSYNSWNYLLGHKK